MSVLFFHELDQRWTLFQQQVYQATKHGGGSIEPRIGCLAEEVNGFGSLVRQLIDEAAENQTGNEND